MINIGDIFSPPEDVIYIYGLLDPVSREVRYIGMTNNPYRRLGQHLDLKEATTKKWIKSLSREPSMKILNIAKDDKEAIRIERNLIRSLTNLINITHNNKPLLIEYTNAPDKSPFQWIVDKYSLTGSLRARVLRAQTSEAVQKAMLSLD